MKNSFIPFDYEKNEEDNKDRNYLLQSNKNVIKNIETNVTSFYYKLILDNRIKKAFKQL
jgi:hypothetical protein